MGDQNCNWRYPGSGFANEKLRRNQEPTYYRFALLHAKDAELSYSKSVEALNKLKRAKAKDYDNWLLLRRGLSGFLQLFEVIKTIHLLLLINSVMTPRRVCTHLVHLPSGVAVR